MAVEDSKASFYVVLPLYCPSRSRRCVITFAVGLLLFLVTVYTFWPSDPDLKIVGLRLKRIKVHPVPPISVDMRVLVTVRVHNTDVYWMELKEVDVLVRYRGKKLGHVEFEHGHLKAKGSSYMHAELKFAGLDVPEMVFLVEDIAKGVVPFNTVTQVSGQLGFLYFHFSSTFEAKLSCDVFVSTRNQTIVRQHCFHGQSSTEELVATQALQPMGELRTFKRCYK